MIESLITALRALAAPVELQVARFPDFAVKAEELALDFDDAYLLARDCRQLSWTPSQADALEAIERQLSGMSGQANAALWTEEALARSAEWQRIRELAVRALESLGMAAGPPSPSTATYVRGSRPAT